MISAGTAVLLALIALLAGIGITAIGAGGVFLTIALFLLTPLSVTAIAGTASATMVVAGVIGSLIYLHSGELRQRANWSLAIFLSLTSIVGGLTGSWLNIFISEAVLGVLLGMVAIIAGAVILYQEWHDLTPRYQLDVHAWSGRMALAALGLGIGIVGGMLGVGGPVLAVPALVLLGVPILVAVAVAQVQSIFIAVFATAGYMVRDGIEWPLVLMVSLPLLVGTFIGWKIARQVQPRQLKLVLGMLLLILGPYLAL